MCNYFIRSHSALVFNFSQLSIKLCDNQTVQKNNHEDTKCATAPNSDRYVYILTTAIRSSQTNDRFVQHI